MDGETDEMKAALAEAMEAHATLKSHEKPLINPLSGASGAQKLTKMTNNRPSLKNLEAGGSKMTPASRFAVLLTITFLWAYHCQQWPKTLQGVLQITSPVIWQGLGPAYQR